VGFDRRPPHLGRTAPPLTQWATAKMALAEDPDSRRAVLLINEPADEVLAVTTGSKDVPCTLSLQFFIRENKLHLHVHMRSNDAVWGLTNDLFSFTLFQECMLLDLQETYPDKFGSLELGSYYHTAGSLHIYERHFELAEDCLKFYSDGVTEDEPMPPLTSLISLRLLCSDEENLRKGYIDQIKSDSYQGGERWLAEKLNEHRHKRDAEESLKGEKKAG
jgi:thymidylate synthase